jgi:pyruvate dehydrogenase (quinone)
LRQQHLPVKVVVFNNGALSFVELEMKAAGIVTYGTDLDNPDFAGIGRAVGLFCARVEKADRLSLPPKLTYGELQGFTLYATRTVLSGGGEELIELAQTNLRELDVE